MSTSYTALLVGSYHHPPAKALLLHLPYACPLLIIPQPDNPYDPEALGVWVSPESVPRSQEEELLPKLEGFGISWEEFLSGSAETPTHFPPLWMLGFINSKPPKDNPEGWCAQTLAPLLRLRGLSSTPATLGFNPDMKPTITLKLEPIP